MKCFVLAIVLVLCVLETIHADSCFDDEKMKAAHEQRKKDKEEWKTECKNDDKATERECMKAKYEEKKKTFDMAADLKEKVNKANPDVASKVEAAIDECAKEIESNPEPETSPEPPTTPESGKPSRQGGKRGGKKGHMKIWGCIKKKVGEECEMPKHGMKKGGKGGPGGKKGQKPEDKSNENGNGTN